MTEKDLLYLSDAFNWNLIALKKYKVYEEFTTGKTSLHELVDGTLLLDNCNEILSILKENNYE